MEALGQPLGNEKRDRKSRRDEIVVGLEGVFLGGSRATDV